jgi:plasmid stabilization system protein ParE
MRNHILTPEAQTNLLDIIDFIARDNLYAPDRVRSGFDHLGHSPGLGHYRDDLLNEQHRFFQPLFLADRLPLEGSSHSNHRHRSWCPRPGPLFPAARNPVKNVR